MDALQPAELVLETNLRFGFKRVQRLERHAPAALFVDRFVHDPHAARADDALEAKSLRARQPDGSRVDLHAARRTPMVEPYKPLAGGRCCSHPGLLRGAPSMSAL